MDITEKFEKLVDEHHQKDANGEPIPHDDEEGISEGTALQVKMALDDVGLKGKWKNNKVYVKKKDVEKAKKALKGNVIYKGKPPEVVGEEAEINEYGKIYAKKGSDYELYHKTFSAAMQHAYAHAKKKGFTVDPKEIDNKVATGPKKPSSGKTNRYILGTDKRKKVHIQVANLDNKRYELNMYIESAINHSAIDKVKKMLIKEKYVTQDKMFPKTLMDGIPKAIPGVKLSRYSIKHPRTGKNIPGLGLMLPGDKGIRVMIQFDKEDAPAPKGMPKTITDIDPDTGKKEVTDTSFRDSYAVWINDIGKIWKPNVARWIQAKDFRDPSKVVQFLKTKVKRMVKSGYMYSSYKKEEVELEEHCGECEMGITEEVSVKEFDALKKGDTVTIEFKSPMSTGKATFKVTAKNVVGKARIEKATLKDVKRPSGVKFFLYKRGNKVSLAQGDMAASVVSFMKEDKDLEKMVKELEGASKMHLGQSKRIAKYLNKKKEEVENVEEKFKKGKYTIRDGNTGKVIATFNSGAKASKEMYKLLDSGKYDELEVKMEETELDEKFAGWIAMYGGKKLEIKKSEADGLYPAKQLAIKHFKVPKSKQGLLAIKPAHEAIDIEKASMGAVIKDFQKSDAPQFKGKSDKKRREMAIAAKLSKEENEDDDPVGKSKKKDKINIKPKMEDKQMKKLKELYAGLQKKRAQEGTLKKTVSDYHKKEVNEASMTYRIRKAQQPEIDKMIKSAGMMKLQIQSSIGDIIKMQKGGDVEITVSGTAKNLRKFDAVVRGKSSYGDPSLLKKEQKEVKEAVLDNGIEVGEQDWDLIARNDAVYPNLNVNFAKYIDEGLEGPYDVGGEVYFYDRKVQMFYSVSSEDYVDEETAKDIAYRLHKNGFYKPELGR